MPAMKNMCIVVNSYCRLVYQEMSGLKKRTRDAGAEVKLTPAGLAALKMEWGASSKPEALGMFYNQPATESYQDKYKPRGPAFHGIMDNLPSFNLETAYKYWIHINVENDGGMWRIESILDNRSHGHIVTSSFMGDLLARAKNVCSDKIAPAFLREERESERTMFRIVLTHVAIREDLPRTRHSIEAPTEYIPIGFLLGSKDTHNENTLYVDLICSDDKVARGGGRIMLDYLLALADKYTFNVSLSSISTVLSFYPRFGFHHRKSCSTPIFETPHNILAIRPPKKDTPWPKETWDQLYDFMEDLAENDYASTKKEDCKKWKTKHASLKKEDSVQQFKEQECEQDGFYMMRCNGSAPSVAPSVAAPMPVGEGVRLLRTRTSRK